jgi:hypothetical protein
VYSQHHAQQHPTTTERSLYLVVFLFAQHKQLAPIRSAEVATNLLQPQTSYSCLPLHLTYVNSRCHSGQFHELLPPRLHDISSMSRGYRSRCVL